MLRLPISERILSIARRLLVRDRDVWVGRFHKIAVLRRLGFSVHSGPFTGMRYVHSASWGALLPRLVGCYEEELHVVIEALITDKPPIVIDVGCAEGYYAVGLARRLPEALVYAFDTDLRARSLCWKMAVRNRVELRVRIGERCTVTTLQEIARPGTAIICDCEGCEVELLDPNAAPVLKNCSILVETHDWIRTETSTILRHRFVGSHHIESIWSVQHDASKHPVLRGMSEPARQIAVSDERWAPQEWLWLRPR
jgi:precorrin-6B methylase 2